MKTSTFASAIILSASMAIAGTGCDKLSALFEKGPTPEEIIAQKLSLARQAAEAGKFGQAVELYKEVNVSRSADLQILKELGNVYVLIGDVRQAILTFKQIVMSVPNDVDAQKALASQYFLEGSYSSAVKHLKTLSELESKLAGGGADSSETHIPQNPELAQTLALALIRSNALEEARQTLESLESAHSGSAEVMAIKGELLIAEKSESEGAELLDLAVQSDDSSKLIHLIRARYFTSQEKYSEAAMELARLAGEQNPDPEVIYDHARALALGENFTEANEVISKALQTRYRDLRLAALLADVKINLNQPQAAIQIADLILSERANDVPALYVKARATEATHPDKSMAVSAAYQRVLAINPAHEPSLHRLWPLFVTQGNNTEAVSTLEMLRTLEKTTEEEDIRLVDLYIETGLNLQRAQKILDGAMKASPGNSELSALSGRLKAKMKEIPSRRNYSGAGGGIQIIKGGR